MFNRLKWTFDAMAEQGREMRANPGPADIGALPSGTGAVGGLGAVPPAVVGAYVGMEVTEVRPLDLPGQPSTGAADRDAARIERLRAQGMSEEQLAMVQAKIDEVIEVHQQSGWTVEFANGNRASVQLFAIDSPDSDFTRLRSRFDAQHTKAGVHAMVNNPTELAVDRIHGSPYEAYYLPGVLAAKGRAHEVTAAASHLGTMQLDRTLAALAVLALHSLEG